MTEGMHTSEDNHYHDGLPQNTDDAEIAQADLDFDDDSRYDFTQAMPVVQAPIGRRATTKRRLKKARTVTVAVISAALLIVATLGATIVPWRGADVQGSAVFAAQVSRTQQQSYCPQRMALADTASYGDSAFQVSEGNITSQALVAAAGSVESAALVNLAGTQSTPLQSASQHADSQQTASQQTQGNGSLSVASASMNSNSLVASAKLAESSDGTGMFGSVASWATQGDLSGLSATQCVAAATQQRFVVPSTQTGWTQQLVIANPGSTAAAVSLTAWGTSQQGALSLATAATVTVQAQSETTVNLSAAANAQRGLVVDVDSHTVPVAAVVRSVSMDGLNPNGSDYVTASAAASTTQVMPTVASLGTVTVALFSMDDAMVDVSWLTKSGRTQAQQVKVYSQQVTLVDLGAVPDGAYALEATSDSAITAQAIGTRDGGKQSDFAISGSQESARVFGIALPGNLTATLVLSNSSDADITTALTGYDASGKKVGTTTMKVTAGGAAVLDPAKLGTGAAMIIVSDSDAASSAEQTAGAADTTGTADKAGTTDATEAADEAETGLHVAASISQSDVSAASLQGIAVIEGTSLDAATSLVTASRDQRIIS